MILSANKGKPSLPVLLFHPWERGFKKKFEVCLSWLRENKYHTIDLETLIDLLNGKELSLLSRPILLTFDDGTLGTYSIVYPLLKMVGFKGVAFVITHPYLADQSERFWWKEVDRSGWLTVESHSHSHGLVFKSRRVVDFYKGEEWGDFFLIKGMDRKLGSPIYHSDYELIHRKYFPEKSLSDHCIEYATQNGGKDFFKKPNWRKELFNIFHQCTKRLKSMGHYESRQGLKTRIGIEINRSKKIIEQTIGRGKEVKFFAYPWGAYNKELIRQLKKAGYRGAFTDESGFNFPGDDPFKIKRITITSDMSPRDIKDILG